MRMYPVGDGDGDGDGDGGGYGYGYGTINKAARIRATIGTETK